MSSDPHRQEAPSSGRLFDEDDYAIEEVFHEYTKLNRDNVVRLTRRAALLAEEPRLRSTVSKTWKTYRGVSRIALPTPHLPSITVEEAIRRRHSFQSGDPATAPDRALSRQELGTLLGLTYGITHERRGPSRDEQLRLRATPSAGGLYPLEIYALAFSVEQLPAGLYHYSVPDHSLETIREEDLSKPFEAALMDSALVAGAPVAFVVTAVMQRTLFRYQHRGYRHIMNDAGALLQSFYMVGTALGLRTAALGDFYDDELAALVGVNSVDEVVAMAFLIGLNKECP